jgi:hypothetical protein
MYYMLLALDVYLKKGTYARISLQKVNKKNIFATVFHPCPLYFLIWPNEQHQHHLIFMSFCRILPTLCSQVVFHNVPHFSRGWQKSGTKSTA